MRAFTPSRHKLRMVVPVTSIDMVKQLCTALDAFLTPVYEVAGQDNLPDINELENVFAFVSSSGPSVPR